MEGRMIAASQEKPDLVLQSLSWRQGQWDGRAWLARPKTQTCACIHGREWALEILSSAEMILDWVLKSFPSVQVQSKDGY